MAGKFVFKEVGFLGKSISVQEMTKDGDVYFRISKLYRAQDGTWKPTDKGVSVPLCEVENLKTLLDGFIASHKELLSETKTISGSDVAADLEELV